jgi:uncharacterized membrane protein
MIRLKKFEWAILIGLLLLSLVPCLGGVVRISELLFGFEIMPANPRVLKAPIPVIIHLAGAVPFCVLGILQFLPSVRSAYPRLHRVSGRLIIIAGVLAALSGLWMTHFYAFPRELQGPLLYAVRLLVGFYMIGALYLGVASIIKRDIRSHGAWMLRAYALGQGAGTQTLIGISWMIAFGEAVGLTRDVLMAFAWVFNLAIVEVVILRARPGRDGVGLKNWSNV